MRSLVEIEAIARYFALARGLNPNDQKAIAEIIVVMVIGDELGLLPGQSMSYIDVIKGKPSLKPVGMMSLVKKSGLLEHETVTIRDGVAYFVIQRKGEESKTFTFSLKDAEKLGLTRNAQWQSQPDTMLSWRVISKGLRQVFPDVIGGLYTTEEVESFAPQDSTPALPSPADVTVDATPALPEPEKNYKREAFNYLTAKGYTTEQIAQAKTELAIGAPEGNNRDAWLSFAEALLVHLTDIPKPKPATQPAAPAGGFQRAPSPANAAPVTGASSAALYDDGANLDF